MLPNLSPCVQLLAVMGVVLEGGVSEEGASGGQGAEGAVLPSRDHTETGEVSVGTVFNKFFNSEFRRTLVDYFISLIYHQ